MKQSLKKFIKYNSLDTSLAIYIRINADWNESALIVLESLSKDVIDDYRNCDFYPKSFINILLFNIDHTISIIGNEMFRKGGWPKGYTKESYSKFLDERISRLLLLQKKLYIMCDNFNNNIINFKYKLDEKNLEINMKESFNNFIEYYNSEESLVFYLKENMKWNEQSFIQMEQLSKNVISDYSDFDLYPKAFISTFLYTIEETISILKSSEFRELYSNNYTNESCSEFIIKTIFKLRTLKKFFYSS